MGEEADSPIVALVGAGRDGSTMLQRLLDGAGGFFMYPVEIKFANRFDAAVEADAPPPAIPPLDRAARRLGLRPGVTPAGPHAVALGRRLEPWAQDQLTNMDENYLAKLERPLASPGEHGRIYDPARAYPLAEALRTFLETVLGRYGGPAGRTQILAWKTIEVEHERRYQDALPDARFVHIVRDPMTQFASTKRTVLERPGFLFHYPVGDLVTTFVKRYLRHARATLAGLEQDPGRHLLVRYEDVTADPAGEVARICSWLGVEPPAEPEALTMLGGRHARELPENPSKPGVPTPKTVVADTARAFGYSTVTAPREERLVSAICAPWAERLGYACGEGPLSVAERARLIAEWVPVERWERDFLHRESGVRSFIRRRLVVLEAALGHAPA